MALPQVPIAKRRPPRDTAGLRSGNQRVADDYFSRGLFRAKGPLSFASYTCLGCGHRSTTWESFRRHRAACANRLEGVHPRMAAKVAAALDPELEALKAAAIQEEAQEAA